MKVPMKGHLMEYRRIPGDDATAPGQIVLVKLPITQTSRYATWWYNEQDGRFSSGHYFQKLSDAALDWEERK